MILRAPFRILWDFWTKPIRAESLALFRIVLGSIILCSLLTGVGQSLTAACGPDGYFPAETNDYWLKNTGRLCLLRGPVNLPLLSHWLTEDQTRAWAAWGARPSSAYLLFGLFAFSLVCMILGLGTRSATIAALLLASTFHHRLPSLMNGGDGLFRNGLYFLILSPAGAVWSLDRFLWRKLRGQTDAGPVMIAPWSVRLMQIQVCTMYLFTGLVKLSDSCDVRLIFSEGWGAFFAQWATNDWLDGQAIYWVLNDVAICRWPYGWLPIPLLICRLMSWGTIVFETGFSFFVCIRPLRKVLLIAGVLLHLGILAVMEIGWFSQVTLCWYILWVPGARISALFQRLRPRESLGDRLAHFVRTRSWYAPTEASPRR